jgi:hypothetical protein
MRSFRLSIRIRVLPNGARSALMIGALRALSPRKARGRPKPFVLTAPGANCAGGRAAAPGHAICAR